MGDELPRGHRIAGFALVEVLGRGSFGITYLARTLDGGNSVAIKEYFPSEFAVRGRNGTVSAQRTNEELFDLGRKAFLDEANILRELPRHSGLVRVRGAFEKSGTVYCVMDYIEGAPLDLMTKRLIKRYGNVPTGLVDQFLQSVCPALDVIHSAGLIHRDIKPANIMSRKPDGQLILIDFGAARPYGKKSGKITMISKAYAAIEQFPSDKVKQAKGMAEGPWSDVFGLSVILYEMVSQSLPVSSEDRFNATHQGKPDPYIPVRDNIVRNRVQGEYPDDLLNLIDRGCVLDPNERLESVKAFGRYLRGRGNSTPASEEIVTVVKKKSRKKPRLSAGAIMLAIIVGLAILTLFFGYISK